MYPLTMLKKREDVDNLPIEVKDNDSLAEQTGKRAIKYKKIAELASRGWTAEMISKEVGLKPARIFRILKREDVNNYVLEIISEKFKEGDKILGWLYAKSMRALDDDISSSNPEVREKAIEKVLKCYGYNQGEGKVPSIIQQIFTQGGPGIVQDIDALIIQKRLERGLPVDGLDTKPLPPLPPRIPKLEKPQVQDEELEE